MFFEQLQSDERIDNVRSELGGGIDTLRDVLEGGSIG